MGLFDAFLKPKPINRDDEAKKLREELDKRLFPSGPQEFLFKSNITVQLSNGKLNPAEAGEICWGVKYRIFLGTTNFDGRTNFGLNAAKLTELTVADSKNKLTGSEAAAIIFYLFFGKIDPSLETPLTLKKHFEGIFGSDSWGSDSDEIPGGLGEFGFDPTNPIPVRGVYSNTIYLKELRTQNGQKIEYKRSGSLDVPNMTGKIRD